MMLRNLLPGFVLISCLLLTGCGGDQDQASDDSGATARAMSGGDNPFLGFVDANSAYVYANLDTMPDAIVDAAWALNDASAESNQQLLEGLENDEEVPEEFRALMDEVSSLLTREGWENAGLSVNPKYAFHAVSVYPFAHMELTNGEAFSQLIERIQTSLEQPLEQRDVDGQPVYWFEAAPGFGIALHHSDTVASAAMIPDQAEYFARLTGQARPAEAMTESQLEAFNSALEFTPHGSGFVDMRRVMDELRSPDSILMAMDDSGAFQTFVENPACIVEVDALTNAMPRMVFGYTELDDDTLNFLFRQEMSSELANALMPISRAPVTIDQELSGMFNFGMAFDLIRAREFAQNLVNGWVENPPACPMFESIAMGAEGMQANLNRPIPPMVTNLQGLFIEAMDFNLAEQMQPEFEGTMSFFMNNPQLLVGMAQMFSPVVAEIQMEPGGELQPVPMEALPPQFQNLDLEAWMGMGENSIGLAVGEAQRPALEQRLEASDADPFLMAGRMDFAILGKFMDIATQSIGQDETELQDMLEVQRQQYDAIADFYDEGSFTIGFTEQGIDFFFGTELN